MKVIVTTYGACSDEDIISADPEYTLEGLCSMASAINGGFLMPDTMPYFTPKGDYCFVPDSAPVLVVIERNENEN